MKPLMIAALFAALSLAARAKDATVNWVPGAAAPSVRIVGSQKEDWRLEESTDLSTWSRVDSFGILASGDEALGPVRAVKTAPGDVLFVRAVQTDGLYDDTLIRSFHLTFTQSNWASLLTTARTTGSNVLCTLELDNGLTLGGVGARYKGNSSFQMGGTKKSVNLQVNGTNDTQELLGFETINLNNAAGDTTLLREPIYFNVMHRYAPSPRGALARMYINNAYWGLYSLAQQEDGDLIREWFPSNDGDRWRAPNAGGTGTGGGGPGGGPGGGGPGGGGGNPFASALSAFSWQGSSVSDYTSNYELKKSPNESNAWVRLVHAIDVLNNTPESLRRDAVEEVIAVDSWLWFLAVENIFADDDSYWNKGADYGFYYEPESGRFHPLEHDGNEAFITTDTSLSPVAGVTGTNRPVISKLLVIPELRQRYLAHMRTALEESFHPDVMTPLINRLSTLSVGAIGEDTKKSFTMATYTNDLRALKAFVTNRYRFLTNHAELSPAPPVIVSVSEPEPPEAGSPASITATVREQAGEGIASVWLWHRGGPTGRYTAVEMLDDGAHQDGAAGDGVYGAATAPHLAGVRVRYYVEARSGNAAGAAAFLPAHAEAGPRSYRVTPGSSESSPVVIHEFMPANTRTIRDPQGSHDDWIELRNVSDSAVDLGGWYLSDHPENPRKWAFPAGTVIPAGGYLLVWADEEDGDAPGLHTNFKLSGDGEQILLVDSDEHLNALRDSVTYAAVDDDVALGRSSASPGVFTPLAPTPGAANP